MNRMARTLLVLAMASAVAGEARAQDHAGHEGHAAHRTHATHATQESHPALEVRETGAAHQAHAPVVHETHGAHAPGSPLTPVPPLTDADRAAAFPELQAHMQHAREFNTYLLFNRLEAWDADHGSGQAWEVDGWAGSDIHRLWLRSEGKRAAGRTDAAHVELLYGRAISPWWDVVAGLRHDFAPGGSQDRAAIGVQGLAPWMVEVAVTGYVGASGRTMLGVEVERELLLTNRLILQPVLEASFHGRDDPARGVGSGLSTVEAGLRLRYEASRRFAPYVGLVHERAFGDTAALRRTSGTSARDTHIVIGAKIWF